MRQQLALRESARRPRRPKARVRIAHAQARISRTRRQQRRAAFFEPVRRAGFCTSANRPNRRRVLALPASSFRFIYKANLASLSVAASGGRRGLFSATALSLPGLAGRAGRSRETTSGASEGGLAPRLGKFGVVGVGERTSLHDTIMCAGRRVRARGLLRR